MPVDPSKLKNLGRRRSLGVPPTDGSPGIEEDTAASLPPTFMRPGYLSPGAKSSQGLTAVLPSPAPEPEPSQAAECAEDPVANGAGEGTQAPNAEPDREDDRTPAAHRLAPGRPMRGDLQAHQRRRVPPPEFEPRIPFTTRVSASTKERLEDACHFLRKKHQDFINEAIIAHLKKNGF